MQRRRAGIAALLVLFGVAGWLAGVISPSPLPAPPGSLASPQPPPGPSQARPEGSHPEPGPVAGTTPETPPAPKPDEPSPPAEPEPTPAATVAPEEETAQPPASGPTIRAVLAALTTDQPVASLPLPPLHYDDQNALLPEDQAFLKEVGEILFRRWPGRVTMVFSPRTAPGKSSPEEEETELHRFDAVFDALGRGGSPEIATVSFDPRPPEPQPLGTEISMRLILFAATDPNAPLPEPLPGSDPGPIATLGFGQTVDLPDARFTPGTAELTEASAEMLATLASRTDALGAERFRLLILPQAAPEEAAQRLEQARFAAIAAALATEGFGWQGMTVSGPAPVPPKTGTTPPPDSLPLAVTLLRLPEALPPDWLATEGAPWDGDAMRFGPGLPGQRFAIGDPRLLAASPRGMVDLWTSPEWQALNGYDPVLLTLTDGSDTSLELHVLDDRSGLAVWTGGQEIYLSLSHDFTGNRPYHISVSSDGTAMSLEVDGIPLEPQIPLPFGKAAPMTVIVGDDAEGAETYTGRIGRVRLWHQAPEAGDLARLRTEADLIPADFDPLAASLSAVIWKNPERDGMELRLAPEQLAPTEGWWAALGEGDIRLLNPGEFEAGQEPPVFSDMQDDWQDGVERSATPANPAGGSPLARTNPHFAVSRSVLIRADDGIDLAPLTYPQPETSDLRLRQNWRPGVQNAGLRVMTDDKGVLAIRPDTCSTSRRIDRWTCPDPMPAGEVLLPFDTDEYVTGLHWELYDSGVRNLFFTTNKRITQVFGGTPAAGEQPQEYYTLALPAGVTPTGSVIYWNNAKDRMIGLSLSYDPLVTRPGITLISETGSAMRFARQWPDQFVAVVRDAPLLRALAPDQVSVGPGLTMVDATRFRIDGIGPDFTLQKGHPEPERGTAFNDTFVSLSKAVNLQSSYAGYDILTMDPLYLMRTGTTHPVFRMPDGDSTDYYDANRIFVPRGLHYFPEYTGQNHATVTTADTYSEYFDSFSDTVSVGFGGKNAPGSFSASLTMSGAKKSISEAKNSRTRGLSRAIFYDLVLDSEQMELDDRFRIEAARLVQTGDYNSFIDMFGTHYPVGVVYGGMGVLEIDASESMRETMRQNGISIKLEASVMVDAETKSSVSAGYEHEAQHAQTFRDVMGTQVENFYWIGGTHAGQEHSSWTVGTDGVVPVHVQLRPIWELLSPVYFEDPQIYTFIRERMKDVVDRRLALAAASDPQDQDDDDYVVELRVDQVACTSEAAGSMVEPGQARTSEGKIKLTSHPVQMFPMYALSVVDSRSRLLRNLQDHEVNADEEYKPLTVHCPSQVNMLERSPYATANQIFRYEMSAEEILGGRTELLVLDRLDLESNVLVPPVDATKADVKGKAFLAGLTLGISVLVDELTNDNGSPIVQAFKKVDRPKLQQTPLNLRAQICDAKGRCPRTKADLDRINGQWVKHSEVMLRGCATLIGTFGIPAGSIPFFCYPRRLDYSVRIVK